MLTTRFVYFRYAKSNQTFRQRWIRSSSCFSSKILKKQATEICLRTLSFDAWIKVNEYIESLNLNIPLTFNSTTFGDSYVEIVMSNIKLLEDWVNNKILSEDNFNF